MVYGFDRPVIILAAPRSGSTLLFETLLQSEHVWTIGDESHGVFERHPELRPGQGCDNNRLVEANCSDKVLNEIRHDFLAHMRNREGVAYQSVMNGLPRLLEKTPKNSLRIPFLNKVFPDALFIYLCRDPKDNISSIIDGWRAGRFVTYPSITSRHGPWSFLLPPGWHGVLDKPLEAIGAFQWQSAHQYIMHDLHTLPRERWMAVNYHEFLDDTLRVVENVCRFMDVPMDATLRERASNPLPMSRYTISKPTKNKWHRNGEQIANILPALHATIDDINHFLGDTNRHLNNDTQVDMTLL